MPNIIANATIGTPDLPSRANAGFFAVEIIMVVVTAPPDGVTVAGLNEQLAPTGNPEHPKVTFELNPF